MGFHEECENEVGYINKNDYFLWLSYTSIRYLYGRQEGGAKALQSVDKFMHSTPPSRSVELLCVNIQSWIKIV